MECIEDLGQCHWNGSIGNCCSGQCMQTAGEPIGYCQARPTSSHSLKDGASLCLKEGSTCKLDGSHGVCCSYDCFTLSNEEFGRCVGSDPPTNIPEKCLPDGADCMQNGSMGFCCGSHCNVRAPHVIGLCETPPTTPTSMMVGSEMGIDSSLIIYMSISAVVAVGIFVGFAWLYWRQRKLEMSLSYSETNLFFNGDANSITSDGYAHEYTDMLPYNTKWEIAENDFTIDWEDPLGEGCYGLVLKGLLKSGTDVAVKTIRSGHPESRSHFRALLSEIKILQYIGNAENIVSMIGCNTSKLTNGKVFMLLEYCPLGSLDKFLYDHKHDILRATNGLNPGYVCNVGDIGSYQTPVSERDEIELSINDLLVWSLQISKALIYLTEKKVIHADVATRNVLLSRRDCAKLTDFGLSRRLQEYCVYIKRSKEPLPWRWMALESIQNLTFSHQSDIWSLGITIWEIFSLGDLPYPGLSWTSDFAKYLENNLRPPQPELASNELYKILLDCWKPVPESRPTFPEIYCRLSECTMLSPETD